ncbi:MAG: FKBP-type peptidyl-prolyl cis-trans isomerase [Gemmatimonadota bacterium]
MREAQIGDRVKVHFTGKLRDGTLVDSSREREPLEFTIGEREVMRGLEELVRGMKSGEVRSARIPPDQAHGKHRNDLLLAVERERFPSHVDPYTGQQLRMKRNELPFKIVTVVATTGDMVLLDTNHPLAGKELLMEVELLEVQEEASEVTC